MRIQPQFHRDKLLPVKVLTPCISFSRDSLPGEQFASISMTWWNFTAAIVIGWLCAHDFRHNHQAELAGNKASSSKRCVKCGIERNQL